MTKCLYQTKNETFDEDHNYRSYLIISFGLTSQQIYLPKNI